MNNTSSTGGYLQPVSTNGELNDAALADFLQGIVVGITGMNGSLVRPRWQQESPLIPPTGTDWAGLGVTNRRPDGFPYMRVGRLYRQEILEVLCSFYGPNSESNSELLSIGFQVSQNLEFMESQGYGLIEVDDPLSVPELINERYLYRVDLGFKLRRVQIYDFSIVTLVGADGTIAHDNGLPTQAFVIDYQTLVNHPSFGFDVAAEFIAGFDTGNWD